MESLYLSSMNLHVVTSLSPMSTTSMQVCIGTKQSMQIDERGVARVMVRTTR